MALRTTPRHRRLRHRTRIAAVALVAAGSVAASTADLSAAPGQAVTYPLTGLPVAEPDTYSPSPALAVKIDNHTRAHPQSGLNEADIVFEEIVEGNITRFAAVFNSTDSDPVGPIRSGRSQDIALLQSLNNPAFAYSGANPGVQGALAQAGWPLLTEGDGMYRESGRPRPHNVFANTSELLARGAEGGAGDVPPQFTYGEPAGTPVSTLDVTVGSIAVGWQWDAEAGVYLRTQGGAPHETSTGQASTNNVVVLVVPYAPSWVDNRSPEADTIGSGEAFVYAGGLKVEATWTRDDPHEPFRIEVDGEPVMLTAGRTWVELANGASYSLTDG